jgi:hypothetical protein
VLKILSSSSFNELCSDQLRPWAHLSYSLGYGVPRQKLEEITHARTAFDDSILHRSRRLAAAWRSSSNIIKPSRQRL